MRAFSRIQQQKKTFNIETICNLLKYWRSLWLLSFNQPNLHEGVMKCRKLLIGFGWWSTLVKERSIMKKEKKLWSFIWSLITFMTVLSFIAGKMEYVLQTLEYLIIVAGVAFILHLCDEDVKKIIKKILQKE
jgi:hypothetical protein